jgi:hypothetical protein
MKQKIVNEKQRNIIFKNWLSKNNRKFNHKLKVQENKKSLSAQYEGIIPELIVIVFDNNIRIDIEHFDYPWDTLRDFDLVEERNDKGQYFCKMCHDEGKRKTYKSLDELYQEHSFKDFLKWTNKNIRSENYLLLEGIRGITCAKIIKPNEIVKYSKSKHLVAIISLRHWKL